MSFLASIVNAGTGWRALGFFTHGPNWTWTRRPPEKWWTRQACWATCAENGCSSWQGAVVNSRAALGLLGAQITVMDLSDEQLANDKRAADHYGLSPVLLQGDMRDLSRFDEDAFDIVYQPFSINFVPDVRPVFAGVARVLKAGGLYHVQWHNPYTQTFNPDDYDPNRGYSSNSTYVDGEVDVVAIYGSDTWGVEERRRRQDRSARAARV